MFKVILYLSIYLFIIGCGGSKNPEILSSEALSKDFIYKTNGKYKNVLKDCVLTKSCKLSKLPLINKDNSIITKNLIMDRVIVSHKWMGDRFSEMLDILPTNLIKLFGAVTSIIIDKDINPSYYTQLTGAIYISPRYLWLTPEEAKTISDKKDYRSNYSDGLIFYTASRYVKNNEYAYNRYSLDSNITRKREDIKINFAKLLYHELSHANDFAPPSIISKLNQDLSFYEAISKFKNSKISTILTKENPLKSQNLHNLGQILYQGKVKTEEDKKITAKEIGSLFENDVATHMYAYSTQYEDLAMLFESIMMKYSFGIEQDIAFLYKKNNNSFVGWGIRNRLANRDIKKRALFIAKSILPEETDWDDFFKKGIGESQILNIDKDWYTNKINTDSDNPSSKLNKLGHQVLESDLWGIVQIVD